MGVNFLEQRKKQSGIIFASSRMKSRKVTSNDPKKTIYGIRFTKGLHIQPRRGDFFGLLSGTGVGKTAVSNIINYDVLSNEANKGYCVIVALELTVDETLDKLEPLFEGKEHLLERLIILDCYNEDGSNKGLTVSDIKLELKRIKASLDLPIDMVTIDHFHEINNNGSTDYNPVAKELKNMFVELDCLGIVLSQTTKEKSQGDIPVPRNGCFGCSRFENLASYILTIFQPLRRVQNECDLPAMGWQLCKIRNKKLNFDKIKEEINYVLKYDSDSENLFDLSEDEKLTFQMYYERVQELRENEEKKKAYTFDLSTYIKGKDGREIKIEKYAGVKDD